MPALMRLPRALAIALLAFVIVAALTAAPVGDSAADPALRAASAPAGLPAVADVSSGGMVSCHLYGDRGLQCVGDNKWGQLGYGTNKDRVQEWTKGGRIPGSWSKVSTSGASTCAVGVFNDPSPDKYIEPLDETLYCWGINTRGQLGIGHGPQQWEPRVVGGLGWQQVSTSWLHTCAIQEIVPSQRKLLCWGASSHGQIGDGRFGERRVPKQVGSASDWEDVTAGGWHTCALRGGGAVYCWGRNDFGQLGTGSTKRLVRPARVATNLRFKSIEATWTSTCGLTVGGKVYCWGENDKGQLGDGTRRMRLAPTLVKSGHTFTDIAVGDRHTCALTTGRAMLCWGGNRYGQHGNGSRADTRAPRQVPGGSWAKADAGWVHTCGLTAGDQMQCWGNNEQGQLGRAWPHDQTTPPGVTVPLTREGSRALDRRLEIVSFNVLGTNHTEPGGRQLNMAPSRIRSEWMSDLFDSWDADIVAFQELKEDQYRHLQQSMGRKFAFYPARDDAGKVVWQSIMWEKAEWNLVTARTISVPVLGKTRPHPIVALRSRLTGKVVVIQNVHNSAGSNAARVRERRQALTKEMREVNRSRQHRRPYVFLGDFNEKREAFCRVTYRTDLYAVNGGSRGRPCRPPRRMRIDWIYVSPEFTTHWFEYNRSPRVTRLTDHSVLRARTTIPGRVRR